MTVTDMIPTEADSQLGVDALRVSSARGGLSSPPARCPRS